MARTDCFCEDMSPSSQAAPVIASSVAYLSSEYRAGGCSLAGFAQTKSHEAKNSKLTATGTHERLPAKDSLPNQRKQKSHPARGKQGNRRKSGKNTRRGSGQTDVISHKTANTVAVSYMPIFNTAVRKRLTYYDSGSITTTAGILNSVVFSVNGLYDPNITGTGHQPAGFDQMMVFFDHYVVVYAKAIVTWANAATNQTAQVALSLNSTVTPVADVYSLCETGYITRDYVNVAGTTDGIKTSAMSCNVSKFQGVPIPKDDPELWGSVSTNPTEQSYFNLSVWDLVSSGTSTIRYQIFIEYSAWFIEPRKVTASLASQLHKMLLVDEKSPARR